ncbi:carbon-nitrogen hydrolase family protein [Geothrix sp. PMB-07]|uniref:carbon-nitrogen hydrolase family protein n=1 Tax=Geothrix sp. PMB-07 TaxID=3068640 RepID=UPI002741CB41|nr:carbon-nitrogen hydrolase family protein [Geothrix sp. PMB-07]WLT33388.1 carbon-nitrogen hydrolase family protein [Geothrix sp. PMB-07]
MRFSAPKPVMSRPVRVCSVQYALRTISSFEEFATHVESFVDVADDYDADLIVFPELLGVQLMGPTSGGGEPSEVMRRLAAEHVDDFDALFKRLATEYERIIVGGTMPRLEGERLLNVASVYFPNAEPVHQAKLHLTPAERNVWKFSPGRDLLVVDTDFGKFAVAICYDVQFPELVKILCNHHGVELLVVPYMTDDRRGTCRVTTCARARAVENQIYTVTAGMVGSLPLMTDLTSQYAQSGIFTPADLAFPMDGIATEAAANVEQVIVADLDLATLDRARHHGSVQTFRDSQSDTLHTRFDGEVLTVRRHFGG